MTTLELTLLYSNIIFLVLWCGACVIIVRTTRALESSIKLQMEHKLAYTTLEQMKGQLEVQMTIIESVEIMNEKIASYNERLNELTLAVRTKLERLTVLK